MSVPVSVPRDILEAGVPSQLLGFYVWLLGREKDPPNQQQAAEAMGVTRQCVRLWARDLEALGLVSRRKRSQQVRYLALRKKTLPLKRGEWGKPKRCAHPGCRVLIKTLSRGGLGDFCAVHKQAHRDDSAWWLEAEKLLKQRVSPMAVAAKLQRQGINCPLWDYLRHDRVKRMPGLVTRAVRAGLLGEEWLDRQRRALDGDTDEWD